MRRIERWWLKWFGFIPESPSLALVAIIGAMILYTALVYFGGTK